MHTTPPHLPSLRLSRRSALVSILTSSAAVCLTPANAQAESLDAPTGSGVTDPVAVPTKPAIPQREVHLVDYLSGAAGQDEIDITASLPLAFAALGVDGGTVRLPAGSFVLRPRGWIRMPANIALVGQGAETRVLLWPKDSTEFNMMFRFDDGDGLLQDISLACRGSAYGYFVGVFSSRVQLQNVVFDGTGAGTSADFAAIKIGLPGEEIRNVTVDGCSITNMGYGILVDAASADIGIINVTGSEFSKNRADDLCLLGDGGSLSGVLIGNSSFTDNLSEDNRYGFGVSVAAASGISIKGCSFERYRVNPVHIERYSTQISIANSKFNDCVTADSIRSFAASVIILSGSGQVQIDGNSFNLQGQASDASCIYVGPGGGGEQSPSGIDVRDNSYTLFESQKFLVNYGSGTVDSTGNLHVGQ